LRSAARFIADEGKRSEVISNIDRLEKSRGTPGYLRVYETFIASVADHMDAFGSFVPPLTKMLSEK
jgi:trehalose-6-phosphate synthase